MKKNYLPIGTVVLLKNAKKRIMITGFYVKPDKNKDVVYDYTGCLYPEGVISSDKNLVFNHEDIDKVYYVGFADIEEQEFKTKLYEAIEKDKKVTPKKEKEEKKEDNKKTSDEDIENVEL